MTNDQHPGKGIEGDLHGAEARTQSDALALAQRVAGLFGASLADWVQGQAREWVHTTLTTPEGKTIRLGASTGGVVSVDGFPFTPDDARILNVTDKALEFSMRLAIERSPAPVYPIRTDPVFVDAPGDVGIAWSELCMEENRLSGYLSCLDEGTAVLMDDDAWFLELDDERQFVLMHGRVVAGEVQEPSSRFDFDLDWVDVSVDDVRSYTARVSRLANDFLVDSALWKTVKLGSKESPTHGR